MKGSKGNCVTFVFTSVGVATRHRLHRPCSPPRSCAPALNARSENGGLVRHARLPRSCLRDLSDGIDPGRSTSGACRCWCRKACMSRSAFAALASAAPSRFCGSFAPLSEQRHIPFRCACGRPPFTLSEVSAARKYKHDVVVHRELLVLKRK